MKHLQPGDSVDVQSDKYFNDEGFRDKMDAMGVDITPVDVNYGFVGVKGESDILGKTQDNIRKRFQLGGEIK